MRFRWLVAVFGVTALMVSATACGDDDNNDISAQLEDSQDSGDSEDSGDSGDSEDSGDSGDSEDSGDSGDSEDSGDSGDAGDMGDMGDLGDLGEGLEDLEDLGDIMGGDCIEFSLAYAGLFLSGLSVFGDEEALEEAQDSLEELSASVPEEMADEFATVAEAYSDYFAELAEEGFTTDAEDPLSDPDVAAADAAISDYLEEECTPG